MSKKDLLQCVGGGKVVVLMWINSYSSKSCTKYYILVNQLGKRKTTLYWMTEEFRQTHLAEESLTSTDL